jgi:hypothetical protein
LRTDHPNPGIFTNMLLQSFVSFSSTVPKFTLGKYH